MLDRIVALMEHPSETFLASLDHPAKPEILAIREVILAVDPTIGEGIKWNAPSFHTSEHFATMNLRVKAGIGVILHFGAKKNDISTTGVAIPDPGSLLVQPRAVRLDGETVRHRDSNAQPAASSQPS